MRWMIDYKIEGQKIQPLIEEESGDGSEPSSDSEEAPGSSSFKQTGAHNVGDTISAVNMVNIFNAV